MTVKAHTYYIIFGRPPIGGGEASPFPPGGATVMLASLDSSDLPNIVEMGSKANTHNGAIIAYPKLVPTTDTLMHVGLFLICFCPVA